MTKRVLSALFAIYSMLSFSQSTTSGTFSGGDIPTDFNTVPTITDLTVCPDTLTINITPGDWVTSIDLSYDMMSTNGAWISDQRSYLRCISTANNEATITPGTPTNNTPGTLSYNRTSNIANGLAATGELKFVLYAFRRWGGNGQNCNAGWISVTNNTWTIDVHHGPPPTCPNPSNFSSTGQGSNSVSLNWTTGGASNWNIEYGPIGFTPGTGTVANTSVNPFTISGLSPSTNYDFYVRDSCGPGDVSTWVGPVSAQTLCNTVSTPFSEDFESTVWVNNAGIGQIDACWQRGPAPITGFYWQPGPLPFPVIGTGPSGDHTTGTGKYMFTRTSGLAPPLPTTIEFKSPPIDLSNLSNPELRFWYHMFGPTIGTAGELALDIYSGNSWTNSVVSLIGEQHTAQTDPWHEAVIDLASFANDTIILRFRSVKHTPGFSHMISFDDITVDEQPSCPNPTVLTASNPTTNSISLNWISGGATNWIIEYGLTGFTSGTGTLINTNTNPHLVTGLNASTTYDFYVRDSCGPGDLSTWIGPVSLTTTCATVAAPYTENFDNNTWTVGLGAANTGNLIDPCWSRNSNPGVYHWGTQTGFTPSNGTGPSVDHTSGTGKYVYTEGTSLGAPATLESPPIDLSALTNPELVFWYHMAGNTMGDLSVDIHDGSSWTNGIFTLNGTQQNAVTDPWLNATVNLSTYANDTIRIRFTGTRGLGFQSDMAIDDVELREAPTCPAPSSLSVSNVTSSTADLNWTSGGAANWIIEYGPIGFTPGTGTLINTNTNPHLVTGLNASTSYDFYLRDTCGPADLSTWIGPLSLTTTCATFAAPYTENFDNNTWTVGLGAANTGNLIDPCWSRNSNPGVYHWGTQTGFTPSNGTGPSVDHTSGAGQYVYTEASSLGAPATLESPPIDLSALTNPELTFWYHMVGNAMGDLSVDIHDGTGWTNGIFTLNGAQQNAVTDPWLNATVNLSAFANDTIRIRFTGTRGAGFQSDMAIDDVELREAPTCPAPSSLSVSNVTSSTADLSWTTGGATDWNIEYGLTGFTPGTGTFINTSTNPHTISGLVAQTAYDFYLRDSCAVGDVSTWIGPITASTACVANITLPYTENFNIDLGCFLAVDGGASIDTWEWNANLGGNTLDGTGFAIVNSDAAGGAAGLLHESLESPTIDASGIVGTLTLEFDQFIQTIGNDSSLVEIWDGTQWVQVLTQANTTIGSWVNPDHQIIDITAYANANLKVRFRYTDNGTWAWWWAIDNFSLRDVLCAAPTNFAGTSPNASSINLSWTSSASGWNIEYGPTGFTPGTGTLIHTTNNPTLITGLNTQTNYDFYLQDSCAIATLSHWVGPFTVQTQCAVVSTPYTEDFEAASWVANGGIGQIDACWQRTPQPVDGFYWQPGPLPFPTPGTGPSGDHTTGTGKFMFTRTSGLPPPLPNVTEFTSPAIDLSSLTNPELRFWYHMFGFDIGTTGELEVDIFSGGVWTNSIFTLTGQQQTARTDPWLEAILSLSAYANDTVLIRFRATKNALGFNHMISIDDITIDEAPSCPEPSLLAAGNPTNNSITLSWTSGGATNWIIEYGPGGFTPGTGTLINTNTNPHVVNGLNTSTTYDFYLRDSCGPGDLSLWIGPVSESTNCSIVAAPYFEPFDNASWTSGAGFANLGSLIDQCWSRNPAPANATYHWGTRTGATGSATTGPNQDNTTGNDNYIFTEASNSLTGATASFESPLIDLSGLTNPQLSFAYHMFGVGMGDLDVDIHDGTSWNNAVFSLIGQQQTAQTDPWLVDTIDLSAYVNDTIQIRFSATRAGWAGDMAIDDVRIFDHIICGLPSNLQALNLRHDSVDLDYTSSNNISNIAWGSPGFTPGAGGNYIPVVTSSPYPLGNLSPNTSYEYYVRDSCGPTSIGAWVGPFSFTTPCDTLIADFNSSRNYLILQFDATGSTNAEQWKWNFGDGPSTPNDTGSTIAHTYAVDGIYNVELIVSNDCGDTDTLVIPTAACDTLKADIVQSLVDTIFTFDGSGSSAGAVNYYWWFGDGTLDTGLVFDHTYDASGVYDVSLVVENICGDRDSTSIVVNACKDPKAIWSRTIVSTNQNGMTVDFVGIHSIDEVSYLWDFGDGNTANVPNPTHTYVVPSLLYNVCLTVENVCGDPNTSCRRLNEIGIDELAVLEQGLKVFPNPSDDIVHVELESTNEQFKIELFNTSGALIQSSSVSPEFGNLKHEIDVSNLPPGIYLLNLKTKQGSLNRKLIVK